MKLQSVVCLLALTTFTACGGGGGDNPPPPPPNTNKAPVLTADNGESVNGMTVTVDVLANDSDPDGDTLEIIQVGESAFATVNNLGNSIQIIPSSMTSAGSETISYTVSDGNGHSVSSNVTLTFTQSVTLNGKVTGLSGDNLNLFYQFGAESASSSVDAQGNFAITVAGQDMQAAVKLSISNGTHELKGYTSSLETLVSVSNSERLVTSEDSHLVVVTPVSTVYNNLIESEFGSEIPSEAELKSFEENLDGDVLLESSALVKMFSQDNFALPEGVTSIDAFLADKAAIWSYSIGLLSEDEATATGGSDGSLVKGVAYRSAKLEAEIENVKALIQPYIKTRFTTNNNQQKQIQSSDTNLAYYQLKPGYQGRIANYDFSGASLVLNSEGTGHYQNEMGASEFSWIDNEGVIQITFTTPISEETYTSAANLYMQEVLPASFYNSMNPEHYFTSAYYTVFITNLDIQLIADNEYVDIVSMVPHYSVSAATIWPDQTHAVIAPPRYQELRTTEARSEIPFTEEELVGQWAMAVMVPAERFNVDGVRSVETNIYSDLLTLNADGTGSALIAEQTLSWNLDASGKLNISQQNGAELRMIRLAQDGKAFGVLVTAELEGKAVSSYRMVIKKEIESFDLAQFSDAYWQASWGLANPQNYTSEGELTEFGYFGFKFNGETSAERFISYLSISGTNVETLSRTEHRFVEVDENNDLLLTSRSSWGEGDVYQGHYSDCAPLSENCYVWRKRQWIPMAQDANRIYMLEPQYMDWQAAFQKTPLDEVNVQLWPEVKANYYEVIAFPGESK